jgi:hypothetical protein
LASYQHQIMAYYNQLYDIIIIESFRSARAPLQCARSCYKLWVVQTCYKPKHCLRWPQYSAKNKKLSPFVL